MELFSILVKIIIDRLSMPSVNNEGPLLPMVCIASPVQALEKRTRLGVLYWRPEHRLEPVPAALNILM